MALSMETGSYRFQTVEKSGRGARRPESQDNTRRETDGEQQHCFFHHKPNDPATIGAQRDTHANFILSPSDHVRDDAVEAKHSQNSRHPREAGILAMLGLYGVIWYHGHSATE